MTMLTTVRFVQTIIASNCITVPLCVSSLTIFTAYFPLISLGTQHGRKRRQKGNTVSDETVKHSYWDQWVIALQTTDPFSRQRGRLRKKNQVFVSRKKKIKIKSGQGSQREARYPDELVDWLSAARWTPTSTYYNCLQENLKEIEKLVAGPRWAPDTKTDWPTDCRS
jgi:hypothetical protein